MLTSKGADAINRAIDATLDAQRERHKLAMLGKDAQIEHLRAALAYAEAALADIGDADREPGDDLAWCERRAAEALPRVRAALGA